jgi:CDP-glycerol glycerophosphotransferase (TagB/SpsB family)
VSKKSNNIKAIWITKEEKIYEHLKSKGLRVYRKNSVLGWYYSIIAGVVVISVCLRDVNNFATAGAKVIQLWHGTPMRSNDLRDLNEDYEMVIVSGEEYLKNEFLGSNDRFRFVLTGYPKNDGMISLCRVDRIEELLSRYRCKKMVMYLPTHRQRQKEVGQIHQINSFDLFDYGFEWNELEKTMQESNALFVMKLHPLQRFRDSVIREKIKNSQFIHLVDPENPLEDVYEYLRYADILVTDYSSVYFDYLLLNRPVIFAVFDYESQLNVRSFRFPFDEISAGPKVCNWPELNKNMRDILSGKDEWEDARVNVNKRFNYYRDDRSSERVYREIRSSLKI